ncbi:MAG: hypothetical protein U1F41_02430 [Burkholderiales bacterium]
MRSKTRLAIAALFLCGTAHAATEIKGAAILDNPCGKVAVKQMGLVNAGKMEDANKLMTREAWNSGATCPRTTARWWPA